MDEEIHIQITLRVLRLAYSTCAFKIESYSIHHLNTFINIICVNIWVTKKIPVWHVKAVTGTIRCRSSQWIHFCSLLQNADFKKTVMLRSLHSTRFSVNPCESESHTSGKCLLLPTGVPSSARTLFCSFPYHWNRVVKLQIHRNEINNFTIKSGPFKITQLEWYSLLNSHQYGNFWSLYSEAGQTPRNCIYSMAITLELRPRALRVLQIKATVEDENSISTMPLTWKFAYRLRAMANPPKALKFVYSRKKKIYIYIYI